MIFRRLVPVEVWICQQCGLGLMRQSSAIEKYTMPNCERCGATSMVRSTAVFSGGIIRAVWMLLAVAMAVGSLLVALFAEDSLIPGLGGVFLFGWSAYSIYNYPTVGELTRQQRK